MRNNLLFTSLRKFRTGFFPRRVTRGLKKTRVVVSRLARVLWRAFSAAIVSMRGYAYQLTTLTMLFPSRYCYVYSFFRIPQLHFSVLRFSEVSASIEHIIYLASRLTLINLRPPEFYWAPIVRIKSRRWGRKFGAAARDLLCRLFLPRKSLFNFWQTFMPIFLSYIFQKGVVKRTGAGVSSFHCFKQMLMYWEYPYLWPFFHSNLHIHYETFKFFVRFYWTAWNRPYFMVDRDFLRFFNFPVILFNLPRLWQPDPSTYTFRLRVRSSESGGFGGSLGFTGADTPLS